MSSGSSGGRSENRESWQLCYTIAFFTLLELLGNKSVLEWCMKEGLIAKRVECPKCDCEMQLSEKPGRTDGYEWRCRKKGKVNTHDVKRSVRSGTWFESSHLNIVQILKMTRFWYGLCKQNFIRVELNVGEHTVVDWYMFCRESSVCVNTDK